MKHLILCLLLAFPAAAQDGGQSSGQSDVERGLRMFMDGLREEVEPALRGLTENAAPYMRQLQDRLGAVVDDLDAYEAPEILPNGDILIRRKEPLPTDGVGPDGAVEL